MFEVELLEFVGDKVGTNVGAKVVFEVEFEGRVTNVDLKPVL